MFGQRQDGLTVGFGRDRGVQVGEVAVTGQLGLAAAAVEWVARAWARTAMRTVAQLKPALAVLPRVAPA